MPEKRISKLILVISVQNKLLSLMNYLDYCDSEYSEKHISIENIVEEQYYFILVVSDSTDNNDPISSDSSIMSRSHIQLPKIKIINFDWDLLPWCVFRDTFLFLVHKNTNLFNLERFLNLLSAISGNARAVVRSVPLSDANYDVAWNALNELVLVV